MFNRIRQIHLFAAFILTVFVLMYFVTGLVMIFEEYFPRKDNAVTTVTKEIPGIRVASGDNLVTTVREHFEARGQYQVRQEKARTVISFRHPGTEATVVVRNHSDSVTMTTKKRNFVAALHHYMLQTGAHLIAEGVESIQQLEQLRALGYDDVFTAADHVPEVMSHRPVACEGMDRGLGDDLRRAGEQRKQDGTPVQKQ